METLSPILYKDVAAYADAVTDLDSIIDSLLVTRISDSVYDKLVSLHIQLQEILVKLRLDYRRQTFVCEDR